MKKTIAVLVAVALITLVSFNANVQKEAGNVPPDPFTATTK